MINNVYQLVAPRTFVVKFEDISTNGKVLIRPRFMALCHADQRYYLGKRDPKVMRKKLPMALIHEAMGVVVADPTGLFEPGEPVVMIPNIAGQGSAEMYENYAPGSGFRSSGHDGFMRELVDLEPDRVVSCKGVDPTIAAITEFVSVSAHALSRFDALAHHGRKQIAVIGSGSLAYTTGCMLRFLYPESEVIVIGHNVDKLQLFTFAHKRYLSDDLPSDLSFDHAFECAGGDGSAEAIDTVIRHIKPQGTLILMGVSEQAVPVNTRDVLEKGMTLAGSSRSGRSDFETAVNAMRQVDFQQRMRQIVYIDEPVLCERDIKRAFATDLVTPFKTVFEWRL